MAVMVTYGSPMRRGSELARSPAAASLNRGVSPTASRHVLGMLHRGLFVLTTWVLRVAEV